MLRDKATSSLQLLHRACAVGNGNEKTIPFYLLRGFLQQSFVLLDEARVGCIVLHQLVEISSRRRAHVRSDIRLRKCNVTIAILFLHEVGACLSQIDLWYHCSATPHEKIPLRISLA